MEFTNELKAVQDLLTDTLNPAITLANQLSYQDFIIHDAFVKTSVTQARKKIEATAFGFTDTALQQLYIRKHQRVITKCKNHVASYLMPVNASELDEKLADCNTVRLYKRIYCYLRELLDFLKEDFPGCFNDQEKVPETFLLRMQAQLRAKKATLEEQLLRLKADKKLMWLVLCPINDVCNEECKSSSFYRLSYIDELVHELEKQALRKSSCVYGQLIQLLFRLDFNCTKFKLYIIELITAEVNNQETDEGRLERLRFHHAALMRLTVRDGTRLMPRNDCLKDEVARYFEKQIHELELQMKVTEPINEESNVALPDKESGILFGLPVEELSRFIAAQKATGMIRNENLTKLAAFMHTHFHTVGKANPSKQSFYNGFSNQEVRVLERLDSKLVDVLNTIRKWKAELKRG